MAHFFVTATADGAGDGTADNWNGEFRGWLTGVRLEYAGSVGALTDTTLTQPYGMKRTILTIANSDTSTTYNPSRQLETNAGAASNSDALHWVDSTNLLLTIADGVENGTVTCIVEIAE